MVRSLAICLVLSFLPFLSFGQQTHPEHTLGYTISVHTYSFRSFTLAESMEMAHTAGVRYLEVYPDQPLGGGLEGNFGHYMSSEQRQALKAMLDSQHVNILAMGVADAKDAADWRALYAFCKEMEIAYLIIEPKASMLTEIGRLATEFQIYTAIHNHPKPSYYWSPEVVLESIAIADSPYVGACADVGHWVRSGLDPVASLKKLAGNVLTLHVKDLNDSSASGSDAILGEGVLDIKGILTELSSQNFQGNFSIEHEDNPRTNLHQVRQSILNFRAILSGN